MEFYRFTLIISLLCILTFNFSFQFVRGDIISETRNKSAVQNSVEAENILLSEPLSGDSFGVSTKIPGVEGAFAVVATDDIGGVYVAYQSSWEENNNESLSLHVYFAYSHDYGESWSKSFRVDDNGSSSVQCDSPSIAVNRNNGQIFIAWKDNRTGVAKVYIDKSSDRGVSFGSDIIVSNWLNDRVPPWLPYTVNIEIGDDGIIYITWIAYNSDSYTDRNILFSYSNDEGQTFSTPIIINSIENEVILTHPWVAIDENDIFVVYTRRDSISSDVYLTRSQNGGLSFNTPVKVTDASTQRYCGGAQVVASSDGKIHVVWSDNRAGDGPQYLDIYSATSMDGGISFGSNVRVNDDFVVSPPSSHPHFTQGVQGTPSIVTDSNSMVHIFWEDFRNFVHDTTYCRDIYYASSKNGSHFSTNFKVNHISPDADSVNCADPNIAIDSQDNFFIVYSDAPSGNNDYHYIYFISVLRAAEESSEILLSSESSETLPSSETSSTFGFQLITIFITLLIVTFLVKKINSKK